MSTVPTLINGHWTLNLPAPRAARAEWKTGWERERLDAMYEVIKRGAVVWDVGAEEGDLSCLYASWGAKVGLFEPSPKSWPWIKMTFEANGYQPEFCFRGFASDFSTGEKPEGPWPDCAFDPDPRPDHGFLSIAGEPDNPHVTLSDVAELGYTVPRVITMDVEGAELIVLRGAERLLRERHPIVFVSVHPEFMRDSYGQCAYDVVSYMTELGYRSTLLAIDHEHHWMFRP